MLGKLQLTEGAYSDHHPSVTPPKNPWHADYWPGISSSGPAVATAAGLCYGALASDTGGSIRWPCAANGLTGLKPSWGRVSRYGMFELAATLDHVGPIARSAADAGAMLGVIAGSDPKDPTAALDPVPDYLAAAEQDIQGLRIGLDAAWNSEGVDGATQQVLAKAVDALRALGAEIVEVRFPDIKQAVTDWVLNCAVEAAVAHETTYPARKNEYGPVLASVLETGRAVSGVDYQKILLRRLELRGQVASLFETIDLLLTPVHPFPPLTLAMIRTLGEQPELIARLQQIHLRVRHDRSSDHHAARRLFSGRIADRVPACGCQSRRSHACARRCGIPADHILASPPPFSRVMEATLSVKSTTPHPGIFYGWFVVLAAFAVTFVGFGCAYTFSAFVESLQRDFDASRGSVSLVFSLAGFLYFGLGIISGPLADRVGSRGARRRRHDPDRAWPRGREPGAQSSGSLRRLWTRRRPWRRLRLCSRHRRGAAMVRPAPRFCLRSRGERHRRRYAGDAAVGLVPDREFGMARSLSRTRYISLPSWAGDLRS